MSGDPHSLVVPNRLLHAPGMIGIPCGQQGRWTEFTRCLATLQRPQGSTLAFNYGAYIQANRDDLVKQCLASDANWLFMVDDDHTFPPDILIRMLDRHVDVVGALALARTPPYFVCAFEEANSQTGVSRGVSIHDLDFASLKEVAAVGTGAILIRRKVLEEMEPPWFVMTHDEHGVNVSEDVVFCERARDAGFRVWLDTAQSIGHLTGVTLALDSRGVVFDLGNEQSIVIPTDQVEEVTPEEVPA
jgi:GT2 family glycosyltransferase